MSVTLTAQLHAQSHDDPSDAVKEIHDALGDISALELFGSQVLCADYIRPAISKGGIKLPGSHQVEDVYQGKVGLIVAMGYSLERLVKDVATGNLNADDDALLARFGNRPPQVGDWVYFMPQQSVQCAVCGPGSKMGTEVRERIIRDDNGEEIGRVPE